MRVRIFQRPKTAMQSGTTGAGVWVLEFGPSKEVNDPLMGWWGHGDTRGQVKLRFDTRDDAVAYAVKHGYEYDVEIPPVQGPHKPKAYADNFKFNRRESWTH